MQINDAHISLALQENICEHVNILLRRLTKIVY